MNSSRGRPVGGGDARDRLLSTARSMFSQYGYTGVSARSIASAAGHDHALVNYYFGSKRGLFTEVMALQFSPTTAVESALVRAAGKPPLQVAEDIVIAVLGVWEHEGSRPGLLDAIEAVLADAQMRAVMGEFITAEVLTKVRAHIGGRDAGRRAAGISTVISGVIFARYLLRVEPMASMPARDVVRTVAPMVALQLRGT